MSSPVLSLEALRAMFSPAPLGFSGAEGGKSARRDEAVSLHQRPKTLPLGLRSIDAALPDGGLPRGAVVEIASARGLGRATSLSLAACASAQALARLRSGDRRTVGAWCAFVDPWSTLHAAGVLGAGVDPTRLLVVRPPLEALARVAVRVVTSRAFSVVVIDTASLPGSPSAPSGRRGVDLDRWGTTVRRLALAVERADTTVLLLTDSLARRSMPLPVAMRLELARSLAPSLHAGARVSLSLSVAKERRGRVSGPVAISFEPEALDSKALDSGALDSEVFAGASDEIFASEVESGARANDA